MQLKKKSKFIGDAIKLGAGILGGGIKGLQKDGLSGALTGAVGGGLHSLTNGAISEDMVQGVADMAGGVIKGANNNQDT